MLIACLFYDNLCQYHRRTGKQTNKNIKSIVRNLTKHFQRKFENFGVGWSI
jgi:hypothetical protein